MTPSPSPTKSDAEAGSLILPPRATTTINLTTKFYEQTPIAIPAAQPTTPPTGPNIEGRIENGEHGLRITVTDFSRKKVVDGGSVVVAGGRHGEEEGQNEGMSWEEKVYCLACRTVIL